MPASWTCLSTASAKRGDFEPLISEDLFYRVQGLLSGRVQSTTPQQRAHPDFPLAHLRALRVLWSRPHWQLVEARIIQPKWRFANARPEPDLR